MQVKALVDILTDGARHKAGTEFATSTETGLLLIRLGWAEELPKEAKAPKKAASKKK
jgi:hypothetical protein